jgi:hypothetical protein
MKIDMRASNAKAQRTRRNVLKAGVVFGSAAISGVKSASVPPPRPHDVIYAEGAPVESLLSVDESVVNFAEYFRLTGGSPASDEVPCAPILSDQRLGSSWKSRYRSAISWMDRRRRIAAIVDRLRKRESVVVQQVETSV